MRVSSGWRTDWCTDAPSGVQNMMAMIGVITLGEAASGARDGCTLVSSWAVAAADGTGGAAVKASAGAVAATVAAAVGLLRRPQQAPAPALQLLLLLLLLLRGAQQEHAVSLLLLLRGLEAHQQMLDRLIRCLTRDSWSRERRHVCPADVGRTCQRALALFHAGLHVPRHSRTCALGLPEVCIERVCCFVLEGCPPITRG